MASPGDKVNGRPPDDGGNERVDFGPSIRTRAQAMVTVAFVIALPALLIGVFRAADADGQSQVFLEAEQLADHGRLLQLDIQRARTALWRLEAEPTPDSRVAAGRALDDLSRGILRLDRTLEDALAVPAVAEELEAWKAETGQKVLLSREDPLRRLRAATTRVRRAVDPMLSDKGEGAPKAKVLRVVHVALDTAWRDATAITEGARELTTRRATVTKQALNDAGRDQLVLFLLLLIAFPLVVGFGPAWMVAPIDRLKGLAVRIKAKQVRSVRALGDDEVAEVTRAIARSLADLEDGDRMKTRKIFEIRKLLRMVLNQIDEPVLILGRGAKLDYANAGAATLLGAEVHKLEGRPFEEICFAPALSDALEEARSGEVIDKPVEATIESADGRVENVKAVLGGVQDNQGRVSRVVVVLHR